VNNYEIQNIDVEQKGKGIGQARKREKGLKFSA
jgi:hypothetical protein